MAPVAETSIRSYRELTRAGKATTQQWVIIRAMREGMGYSRREISRLAGLEINAVCGRVNELLKIGALVETTPKRDPLTKKMVQMVMLNTGERQVRLF